MKNVDYEGPQTKFNLVVKELPQFKSLSHIYSKADSHDEQIKKAKNFLTGTIHMGCSSLKDIHNAYLDVIKKKSIFQFFSIFAIISISSIST